MLKKLHSPMRMIIVMLVAMVVLVACSNAQPTKDTSASSLLPNPAGYTVTDVTNIQDALTKITAFASLGAGAPEVSALAGGLNKVAQCYQATGAIEARTYINNANPLNAGVLVIINQNLISNPATFGQCVLGVKPNIAQQATVPQPCARTCSITQNNNTYWVAYVGSSAEVCSAFDAGLTGCQ